jgi:chemotaxis regulatin CheY-phosphate phosphatase CheZ
MDTREELDTVWELVNLLEKLSNILWDRYHDYLLERHLDEEEIRYFEEHLQNLLRERSKKTGNLANDLK